MNESRAIHILTIEDPIEFVHPVRKATFNQRELGTDFDTFASALKASLRQAPKVILVGEMRDRETVELGLAAASTGHLVLSTLHSIDAGQTINRIVGMFEKDEEAQIRAKLAECLRFVVNQRLLPKKGGGRVGCQEIMGMNLRVNELVVNGESDEKTFYDITTQGRSRGWQTHDQVLCDLYVEDKITEETALAYASKRPILQRMIDRIKQERGVEEDDGLDLSLDTSGEEFENALKRGWPRDGTYFPVRGPAGNQGELIVYGPSIVSEGRALKLTFPCKINGTISGLPAQNPSGEITAAATGKGMEGQLLVIALEKLNGVFLTDKDVTKTVGPAAMQVLPREMKVLTPVFNDAKKEALAEIVKVADNQHLLRLQQLADAATDPKEREAVEKALAAIKERLS